MVGAQMPDRSPVALSWVDAEGLLYLYAQWKAPRPASVAAT
jgi:hypothetical protein